MEITFTIPDANTLKRITDAMKARYSIPLDEEGNPTYSDSDWAKFCIKRFVKNTVIFRERKVAIDAIQIGADDIIE